MLGEDVVDHRGIQLAQHRGVGQPGRGQLGHQLLDLLPQHLLLGEAELLRDVGGGGGRILDLLRVHHQPLGHGLLGDQLAVAVEDRPPADRDRLGGLLLRLGLAHQLVGVDGLDLDRPPDDQSEADHGKRHQQPQPAVGDAVHGRPAWPLAGGWELRAGQAVAGWAACRANGM